ncbi:hypothetical protein HK405_014998 [Cladochytrium tenue]|nr:hypothetical protein HK405_014998 [Cladochytrium tenue]
MGPVVVDHSHYWLDGEYMGSFDTAPAKAARLTLSAARVRWGAPGGHTLTVLAVSAGLAHWGLRLETSQKGFLPGTRIMVDGVDVTQGTWNHSPGLAGERLKWYAPNTIPGAPWRNATLGGGSDSSGGSNRTVGGSGPTWFYFEFPASALCLPQAPGRPSSWAPLTAYALHVGGMGQGAAWLAGRPLGRYWARPSLLRDPASGRPYGRHPRRPPGGGGGGSGVVDMAAAAAKAWRRGAADNAAAALACPPAGHPDCDYGGAFDEPACRHGCGEVVQPFLHVPLDWVAEAAAGDGTVRVVLLEEGPASGADPASVYLVRMVG